MARALPPQPGPQHIVVSPFMYDVLTAYFGGSSPYLARKRAELLEARRRHRATETPGRLEDVARSTL